MGQLIHIVQLSVTLRGWLKPHPTKWAPLTVSLQEEKWKASPMTNPSRSPRPSPVSVMQLQDSTGKSDSKPSLSARASPTASADTSTPVKTPIRRWDAVLRSGIGEVSSPAKSSSAIAGNSTATPQSQKPGLNLHTRLTHKKLMALLQELATKQIYGVSLDQLKREFERRYSKPLTPDLVGLSSAAALTECIGEEFRVESFPGGLTLFFNKARPQSDNHSEFHSLNSDGNHQEVPSLATPTSKRVFVDADKLKLDLRDLLCELLSKPGLSRSGFQLAFLKSTFSQRFGYKLDHAAAGYPKLKALLLSMDDICVVSAAPGGHGLLFPAGLKPDHIQSTSRASLSHEAENLSPHRLAVTDNESCSSSAHPVKSEEEIVAGGYCEDSEELETAVLASLSGNRGRRANQAPLRGRQDVPRRSICHMM